VAKVITTMPTTKSVSYINRKDFPISVADKADWGMGAFTT